VQGKCVCSIMTPAHGVCGGDPRYARLQLISDQVDVSVMKLAECLNGTKTSSVSKDQGKFGFSCHDPFKCLQYIHGMWSVLVCLQELRGSVSQCRPLRALVGRLRTDVGQLEALKEEMQRLNDSLSVLQERFTLHHYQQLQQREFILQRHLHSCSSQLGCGLLTGISAPLTIRSSGSRFGSWMMDSLIDSTDNRVWVMDGYFKGRRLVEYQSLGDFATGQNFIVHHLPHPWAGTGHVVYNGSLYYNKHHSNVLVRYDLTSGGVLQQRPLAQAGFNNTFPYSWGGSSDIDLMADETGLWAVYSSIGRGGNMLLSRLHPDSLEVLRSWDTGFSKRSAGEAFLICGSLYVTNSHLAGAKVHFTFHTASASYEYTDIAFHNQYSHISMLDYNPRIRALYTWNNGHQVLYDITLLHFIRTHI
uniref:Noelin-2-like n=1 Tax=Sinocyclocheilus grahami TaxID=75366 RepID=A0A672MFU1_SINGR